MKEKGYLRIVKVLSLAVILMFTLYFQGCNSNNTGKENKTDIVKSSGEIVETKLTDREKELLQGLDIDKYFIFDANIKDKKIGSLELWVDYYEKGSFKNKCFGLKNDIQLPKEKNIKMIFSTQKFMGNKSEEKWTFSTSSNRSGGKGSTNIKVSESIRGLTWASIQKSEIVTEKEMILAAIAGTEENGMSSISIDEINADDEVIKNKATERLLKNDYVYIIKCKFR
ncbi:hypothetical protein JOC70_001449 [Clostridium pascui]|uniref:hypothetical protein n=1 Tax=Clostridium pascui TaxID=46609 RepID=UPI00195C4D98|nr:hypothetical protein [Clostridium pascui]MBM7869979.1 hypothetical protein [Clostridium pascui]